MSMDSFEFTDEHLKAYNLVADLFKIYDIKFQEELLAICTAQMARAAYHVTKRHGELTIGQIIMYEYARAAYSIAEHLENDPNTKFVRRDN